MSKKANPTIVGGFVLGLIGLKFGRSPSAARAGTFLNGKSPDIASSEAFPISLAVQILDSIKPGQTTLTLMPSFSPSIRMPLDKPTTAYLLVP